MKKFKITVILLTVITDDELWVYAMALKPTPNNPNESIQKSQDRKKHVKFGQIWRISSRLSSFAMVYQEVVCSLATIEEIKEETGAVGDARFTRIE